MFNFALCDNRYSFFAEQSVVFNFEFCSSARRIEYDYDRFGDSPACMGDDGTELADMKATSEGWGLTEKGRPEPECHFNFLTNIFKKM